MKVYTKVAIENESLIVITRVDINDVMIFSIVNKRG